MELSRDLNTKVENKSEGASKVMLFSVIAIPRGDCLKFVGAAIHCCRLGSSSLSPLARFLIIHCHAEIIITDGIYHSKVFFSRAVIVNKP